MEETKGEQRENKGRTKGEQRENKGGKGGAPCLPLVFPLLPLHFKGRMLRRPLPNFWKLRRRAAIENFAKGGGNKGRTKGEQRENKGRTKGEQGGQGGRPLSSLCSPYILKGECYADLCRNFENFANLCRNFENFAKFRQRENFGKKILADGRRYGEEEKGFFLLLLYRRPLQVFFFSPET